MGLWAQHVLPFCVEKACRSHSILEERRRWLPRATGHVLEIGVGSGLNLAFYDPASAADVVAVDPSEPLLARARERVHTARIPVDLVAAAAESLPFDAARFDSAVITYTLCSVTEPGRALAEVRRVLRPRAPVILVEHGLAPDESARRWQRRITPLWKHAAGNCHLDRDVRLEVEGAGLRFVDVRESYAGDSPRWFSFTVEGIAVTP